MKLSPDPTQTAALIQGSLGMGPAEACSSPEVSWDLVRSEVKTVMSRLEVEIETTRPDSGKHDSGKHDSGKHDSGSEG